MNSTKPMPETLWWTRIGRSLRLLASIQKNLSQETSFLLYAPQGIPWEEAFQERLRICASGLDPERSTRMILPGREEPGRFCLRELCPGPLRKQYWPSQSCAAFLCSKAEIPMHRYFILVRELEDEKILDQWISFVSEYRAEARRRSIPSQAVFILSYPHPLGEDFLSHAERERLKVESYTVRENDSRVFCMEDMEEGQFLSGYLIELAVLLAGDSPQICHALLEDPKALIGNPSKRCHDLLPDMKEETVHRRTWQALVRHFFPLLEQYRQSFITRHAGVLQRHLPISNGYGGTITSPEDLELGHLSHIIRPLQTGFTREDKDDLAVVKAARNHLAHFDTLSEADIRTLAGVLEKCAGEDL